MKSIWGFHFRSRELQWLFSCALLSISLGFRKCPFWNNYIFWLTISDPIAWPFSGCPIDERLPRFQYFVKVDLFLRNLTHWRKTIKVMEVLFPWFIPLIFHMGQAPENTLWSRSFIECFSVILFFIYLTDSKSLTPCSVSCDSLCAT